MTIDTLAKNWWALAIRGGIAILFGILAILWPDLTVGALVLLFGAYALVDGVFAIIGAIRAMERKMSWGGLLFEGILGIAVGLLTFVWPGLTALGLLYFIAAWALVTGIFEIVTAIRLRKEIEGEFLMILTGAASALFGIILFIFPGDGAIALIWVIGIYAIMFGALLLIVSFRLKSLHDRGGSGSRMEAAGTV